MASNIKYNVYYSTTPDGPWTKANTVLISDNSSGNSYTITDLTEGVLYYVMVVGGILDDFGNWIPLSGQPIGPNPVSATQIDNPNKIAIATYSPNFVNSGTLSMNFGVV